MNDVSIEVAMNYCHKNGLYPRLEEHDEQIRADREKELEKAFVKLLGAEYSWWEILELAERLKEQSNGSN